METTECTSWYDEYDYEDDSVEEDSIPWWVDEEGFLDGYCCTTENDWWVKARINIK